MLEACGPVGVVDESPVFPSVVLPLLTDVVGVGVLVPPTMLVPRPVHYSVTVSLFMYEDALYTSQAKLYFMFTMI